MTFYMIFIFATARIFIDLHYDAGHKIPFALALSVMSGFSCAMVLVYSGVFGAVFLTAGMVWVIYLHEKEK